MLSISHQPLGVRFFSKPHVDTNILCIELFFSMDFIIYMVLKAIHAILRLSIQILIYFDFMCIYLLCELKISGSVELVEPMLHSPMLYKIHDFLKFLYIAEKITIFLTLRNWLLYFRILNFTSDILEHKHKILLEKMKFEDCNYFSKTGSEDDQSTRFYFITFIFGWKIN